MKGHISNPFITSGYLSPEYFCDRKEETGHLLKAINSRRNVTLISLRRMGKTGLLKHVKFLMEGHKKSLVFVYADLLTTTNCNDMLNTLASALLREKQNDKSFLQKILTTLAYLRPQLSLDELTGKPVMELKVTSPADIRLGLDHLMQFLSDKDHEFVVALDEFQQIMLYPEKNTEQLLRSVIQSFPRVSFIFSGSSKHMLEPMFSSPSRAFYQSSELMFLENISPADFQKFIREKFASGRKSISDEVIDKILEWTRVHTWYVQFVCNLLYESSGIVIDNNDLNRVFAFILDSYEPLYSGYRKLIPPHQYSLLKAIAMEKQVEMPTSGAFIHKYGLKNASSVNSSLKALEEKEMIIKSRNSWQVYDVFLSRWLEYKEGRG